jgi:hypothetical protein
MIISGKILTEAGDLTKISLTESGDLAKISLILEF